MLVVQLASFSLHELQISRGEDFRLALEGEDSVDQATFYPPPPCFIPSHHSDLQSRKFRSWEEG